MNGKTGNEQVKREERSYYAYGNRLGRKEPSLRDATTRTIPSVRDANKRGETGSTRYPLYIYGIQFGY